MRAAPIAAALALVALCPGCGLVALAHDSAIGPVSPAGRVHAAAVGSEFRVTEEGPVAELGDDARLRPYPRDLLERVAAPHSFWSLVQGVEAFLGSISPVTSRVTRAGRLAPRRAREDLPPGTSLTDALARLGPPALWLRRSHGSVLLYRSTERSALSFYLGVPPPAAALVPVPGIGNLYLRRTARAERAQKLLLFFDRDDRLVDAVASPGA